MARYRKVYVRMWGDEKFRCLSPLQPSGQALWIYLVTNPSTTSIPGLYRAGESQLAEELEWPLEAFREAFREVIGQGLAEADWKARVIWLPGGIKYNQPESPNVVKSWSAPWDDIPECALKTKAFQQLKAFTEGLGKAFGDAFGKSCRKPLAKTMPNPDPDQEPDQEQDLTRALGPRNGNGGGTLHPLPSPAPDAISAYDLLQAFGSRWRDRWSLPWTPDRNATAAARDLLEEQIGRMDNAKDRAAAMGDLLPAIDRYLADKSPSLEKNRHPFPWFVDRFNQYRSGASLQPAAPAFQPTWFDPNNQPR